MLAPESTVKELKSDKHEVSAWVEIDNAKVNIFGAGGDDEVMSGFIESPVGKEYSVGYKLGLCDSKEDIIIRTSVDGSEFAGTYELAAVLSAVGPTDLKRVHRLHGTIFSPTQMKRHKFVPIVFTDNESLACQNEKIINGLGTIELKFFHGTIGGQITSGHYAAGPVDQSPIYRGLAAQLNRTERTAHGRTEQVASYIQLDSKQDQVPFLTIKLYYRSSDILWSSGMIPSLKLLSTVPDLKQRAVALQWGA